MKNFGLLMAAVVVAAVSAFGQQKVVNASQCAKVVSNDSVKIEKCERRACDKVAKKAVCARQLKCDTMCVKCDKQFKCNGQARCKKVCENVTRCASDSVWCCKAKVECCKARGECKKNRAECCKAKVDCCKKNEKRGNGTPKLRTGVKK